MNRFLLCVLVGLHFGCQQKSEEHLVIAYHKSQFTLDNGVLFYNNHPYSGALIDTNKVTKIVKEIEYLNGKKHGKETKKYAPNSIAEQRFYTHGNKSGTHKAWWSNGQLKFEYHFNTKGEHHGPVNEWYINGQQAKAFHFVNGKEEGTQKMWQKDGKLRANFVTKNGERFGLIGLKKCYSVNTKNEDYD